MPQTLRNSSTKTRPKTTSLQPQASTFPPTTLKNMMHRSSTNASSSSIREKMTGKTPLEIGTRGTVGSLIMQEIEYFSRLEINCKKKPRCQLPETACTSSCSRPKLGSLITTPKKKKKGSSRLIPSMCSMVDVVERNQPNLSSGFSYRTLKADVKTLQV